MRLIEVRLLEGPNLYRLEPAVKLEVAIGRRRTWYGRRDPEPYNLVRLSAAVPSNAQPARIAALAGWVARLRREHPDGAEGRVLVHRSSDPGYWIVTWPWLLGDRAREIAESAFALVEREVPLAKRPKPAGARRRLLERVGSRIAEAEGTAPNWIRDPDRRIPVVSISGTNGKTTTTRLTAHILRGAGKRVGATTSDGIVVGDALVEKGDWTGPGGAQSILRRDDLDVAVLETARGGILLRGMGYESNEAAVITNVSSDHLDLQGIHTLPELAEVKGVIARVTKPSGTVVLNADDRWVAGLAREVRAAVAYFSLAGEESALVRRHVRRGGRAYVVRDGWIGEAEGSTWRRFSPLAEVPIALGGIARHNVANALAAVAAARAMGVSIEDVGRGLRTFRPTTEDAPGRLNVFRDDRRIVIVDFAHNEAGITVLLDVAAAMATTAKASITAIIGTAGDRPDDTLRGLGRIAAERADRVVIKETLDYLRGRTRASVIGELKAGTREGGWQRDVPVLESEVAALAHELDRTGADGPEVIALLCHEQRDTVFSLLVDRGFSAVTEPDALTRLAEFGPPSSRRARSHPSVSHGAA